MCRGWPRPITRRWSTWCWADCWEPDPAGRAGCPRMGTNGGQSVGDSPELVDKPVVAAGTGHLWLVLPGGADEESRRTGDAGREPRRGTDRPHSAGRKPERGGPPQARGASPSAAGGRRRRRFVRAPSCLRPGPWRRGGAPPRSRSPGVRCEPRGRPCSTRGSIRPRRAAPPRRAPPGTRPGARGGAGRRPSAGRWCPSPRSPRSSSIASRTLLDDRLVRVEQPVDHHRRPPRHRPAGAGSRSAPRRGAGRRRRCHPALWTRSASRSISSSCSSACLSNSRCSW